VARAEVRPVARKTLVLRHRWTMEAKSWITARRVHPDTTANFDFVFRIFQHNELITFLAKSKLIPILFSCETPR
jgi:hypothetical protein